MERWVRLNPLGREVVRNFLDLEKPLPSRHIWTQNLKRWAEGAGMDPKGLSAKTTRKTWESWLVHYYPGMIMHILNSQGHNAFTALNHYINTPFGAEDKIAMKDYVEGWV